MSGAARALFVSHLARMGAQGERAWMLRRRISLRPKTHAGPQGLVIDYRCEAIEDFEGRNFDLVASLEVIEHVDDPAGFVAGLADGAGGRWADDPLHPQSHRYVKIDARRHS